MGCDIHVFTEIKNREGKWVNADNWVVNEYYEKLNLDTGDKFEQNPFYRDRDYELFSALAGVRGRNVKSLEPKGLPEDISKESSEYFWGGDLHSTSHLTLKELQKHHKDLGGTTRRSGMVSPQAVLDLEKGITPDSWCQWTTNPDYVYKEWADFHNCMDRFMELLYKFLDQRFYNFEVRQIKENPDNFRIVFGFDN